MVRFYCGEGGLDVELAADLVDYDDGVGPLVRVAGG
jgi:hypothetical protein